jgi:class 3 adenylate cyclase/tetratricopeptide (TPR) repeat protein
MDIDVWLRSLGLEEYEAAFRENEIDATILPSLTAEDLKDLGVRIVGHRRKLMNAIAALGTAAKTKAPTPEDLARIDRPVADTAERRQVTVMFVDLVGSTALAADMDPEDLSEVISAYQICVAETARRFDGFVAQYLGDGVLVYFGYPQAREDDAERAILAGLCILKAVETVRTAANVTVQTRVAIGSGVVIVGDLLRKGATQESAAIGETTNLVARLQAIAEPNSLVISPVTHRLVGALFDYRDLGRHTLKGFPETVHVRQVLGPSKVESRFEAQHQSGTSPLLGREEELELLLRRWEQAKRGEGRVVLLTGEPGIGKSRIARALRDRMTSDPHTALSYFCSPHYQGSALYPVIGQLTRAAGIERDDSAEVRLHKIKSLLAQSSDNLDQDVALIAALLSIPGGDHYTLPEMTPQRQKERTLAALLDQLKRLGARQPILTVYEDLHWIDPTSLELLSLTIEQVRDQRILLVATARPEFTPPWPGYPHVSTLSLNRIGRSETEALIADIAKGKVLPSLVRNQIVTRTDGVPLFVEELTKTVLESGLLLDLGDRFELTGPLPPLAIPSTLHASLLARLDRLAAVKDVAQIGAVIGREFSYSLIAAVAKLSERDLNAALAQLVAAELIFQRGVPPDATYHFKHALVQDASYASLVRSRRQQLHAAIVKELVAGRVSDTGVKPEVLAHHYAEAGMAEEAVRHYREASEQSVARSALAEAALMLEKALGQVAQLPACSARDRSELEVQCARGAVLIAVKGFAATETGQAYSRARDLWDRLDRPPEFLLRMARGKWSFHNTRSEFLEAQSVAEDVLEFGRAHGDIVGLIIGHFTLGLTHMNRGELLSARASLEEVIGLQDLAAHAQLFQYAGPDPNVTGLAEIAHVLLFLGYPDQAFVRAEAAIRQARQLAHAPTVAQCLALNARHASILGDEERLATWVQELHALTEEHGYPLWSALVPIFQGQLQLTRGEARAAVTLMRQGLDAFRATGATLLGAHFAILLGEALTQDGSLDEALSLLEDHIAAVSDTGELCFAAELHRRRGQLLLKGTVPDFAGAEAEFLLAVDIARGQSAKLWELRAAVSLARLRRDQDRNTDAHHLLTPIYAWFTEGFDCADLKAAKLLLEELSH